MMFNPTPYKEVKADYQQILFPTSNYISNHWIMGQRSLRGAEVRRPQMTFLNEGNRLSGLENQLKIFLQCILQFTLQFMFGIMKREILQMSMLMKFSRQQV